MGAWIWQIFMTCYKFHSNGDKKLCRGSRYISHRITIVFYSCHFLRPYNSSKRKYTVIFFLSPRLCWLFYFCPSSFTFHPSLASEELGFHTLWLCVGFHLWETPDQRARGVRSQDMFSVASSLPGHGLALAVVPLMKIIFVSTAMAIGLAQFR